MVFFANRPQSGLIATLAVVITLLIVTYRHRPCRDVVSVNFLRLLIYVCAAWSLIASLVGTSRLSYGFDCVLFLLLL